MARPREFDPEQVLSRALDTFWRKGYTATSLDDLVTATAVGRQSLYNAFGGKEQLYREALTTYCESEDATLTAALEGGDSPFQRVRALVMQVAEASATDRSRRGCFALNAGVEGAGADTERLVSRQLARLEDRLAGVLSDAREAGELTTAHDPRALARFLVTVVNGLRALGRAHPDPDLARDTAQVALSVLEPGQPT